MIGLKLVTLVIQLKITMCRDPSGNSELTLREYGDDRVVSLYAVVGQVELLVGLKAEF